MCGGVSMDPVISIGVQMGRGVAQNEAHWTTDREVPSMIPAGTWVLLFSVSLNQWCILNQVPLEGATLLVFNFPTIMEV